MPSDSDNILLVGGKVLAGAAILITFLTMVSAMSPQAYPMVEQEDAREPGLIEKARDFIMSFPYNFCIGGTLVILSVVASYYSKAPEVAGDILRTLGPFQGYIFGFGIVLIFVPIL